MSFLCKLGFHRFATLADYRKFKEGDPMMFRLDGCMRNRCGKTRRMA